MLVAFDYKSFHVLTLGFEAKDARYMRMSRMDMHSFVACCGLLKVEDAQKMEELPDDELLAKLAWYRKQPKLYPEFGGMSFQEVRDQKAKRCIAEGQLVLTDKGEVPIEKITLAHRLWDGVNWVSHSGLIDQGIQEVITYDGLTATPDHPVFTRSGKVRLDVAALRMERLIKTGSNGTPIRVSGDYITRGTQDHIRESKAEDLQADVVPMCRVRTGEVDRPEEFVTGQESRLSIVQSDLLAVSDSVGSKVRRDSISMYEGTRPSVEMVWSTWNNVRVSDTAGVCVMGGEELTASNVQGSGNRPDGQQRELRTGQLTASHAERANGESAQYSDGELAGSTDSNVGMEKSILASGYLEVGGSGDDRRGNNTAGEKCQVNKGERMAPDRTTATRVRVYDILNAGPNFRYTVSNSLILNCILGIGFGQMAFSLYRLNPESFKSPKESQMVLDELNRIYPLPEKWRNDIRQIADRDRQLVTRHGFVRRFWDVYRKRQVEESYQAKGMERISLGRNGERWCLKPGDDHEACIAYLPANNAFGMIRSRMVEMGREGWDEKFGLVNTIHDSVVFDCHGNRVGDCLSKIGGLLERPSSVLVDPDVAPGGLWCGVDAKVGKDLAHMEKVDWRNG